jgi:type I restriction-modification system DNA methylase subunit
MKTEKQMAAAAAEFAKRWEGRGYEKGDSQSFWFDLLSSVYGVETPSTFIRYEEQVKVDKTNFIDGYIDATHVLIEQKGSHIDPYKKQEQSDGMLLTPFEQARRYANALPYSQRPRWIVICNFKLFLVYDMEQPNAKPEEIKLEDLEKEYYRLKFLVDVNSAHLHKEERVSIEAGEIVTLIHKALTTQYDDNSPRAQRWLNILCVRIVFCLYAEDAGIFAHDQFYDYLSRYEADDFRNALIRLFEVLNTPEEKRSKYLKDDLKAFPYTNGGLFEEEIEIPQFTEELRQTLLQHASLDFDWSEISPTIFGAVFESTLNPDTRRSGGMHYTSIENIHKVIDPLFLNDLRQELDTILEEKVEKKRVSKLEAYQDKLASLTFLDPACGSGNFLTETFLSLRRLENIAIRERYHGQSMMGEFLNPIKVNINQFYGIEINDFAAIVATTALWISESQMLAETERIIHKDIDFLPLKSYTSIKEGNALRLSWDEWEIIEDTPTIIAKKANVYPLQEPEQTAVGEPVATYGNVDIYAEQAIMVNTPKVPQTRHVEFDYIISNPPFVGYALQTKEQKEDIHALFPNNKLSGKIDYVSGWYLKASQLMKGTNTRTSFVSTNSITQGEQVAAIWKSLFENYGIHIDFAYRTFIWDNEASKKAHVHCVIVGFSWAHNKQPKVIYQQDECKEVGNINAYLMDAPNIFIEGRLKPLSNVPKMILGSIPRDGGFLSNYSEEEYDSIIEKYPDAKSVMHPILGSVEFLHNKKRYCLWLKGANPSIVAKIEPIKQAIVEVRKFRLESTRAATNKMADFPTLFAEINQPDTNFIAIPEVSSQNRKYVPMNFLSPDIICTNKLKVIPDAEIYHFGVLESYVHMAWMRAVCGRLKSDYDYSSIIVYNNFPWPNPTEEQKAKIEKTAQTILDVRALYPDNTLAELYDEEAMPVELRKAHQANDKAVMEAYGFDTKLTKEEDEPVIVAELFKLYQKLTKE